MMQGQSYQDVAAASIPSNFYGHDSMAFDQYRQGHGSDGPVQSWQTLAQQDLNQAENVATEQKMKPRETKKIDPKIEKSNKSLVKINAKCFSLKMRFTLFFAIVFVPGPAQETSKIRQEAAQEPPNSVQ